MKKSDFLACIRFPYLDFFVGSSSYCLAFCLSCPLDGGRDAMGGRAFVRCGSACRRVRMFGRHGTGKCVGRCCIVWR